MYNFYGTVSKEFGTVGEESENIMGYRVIVWVQLKYIHKKFLEIICL